MITCLGCLATSSLLPKKPGNNLLSSFFWTSTSPFYSQRRWETRTWGVEVTGVALISLVTSLASPDARRILYTCTRPKNMEVDEIASRSQSMGIENNPWQSIAIHDNRWQTMAIEKHKIFVHRLVFDYVSSIDQAGYKALHWHCIGEVMGLRLKSQIEACILRLYFWTP